MALSKQMKIPRVPPGKGDGKRLNFNAADANKLVRKATGKLKTLMKKPAFAKGGQVKTLLAQYQRAVEMGDQDAAKRAARQLDSIQPGLSRKALDGINEGQVLAERVKLSTFSRGGVAGRKDWNPEQVSYARLDEKKDIVRRPEDRRARVKFGDRTLRSLARTVGQPYAKGGAISDVANRMKEIRRMLAENPKAPDRDKVLDEYNSLHYRLQQQTGQPVRKAGGGKVSAVNKLTRLMQRYMGDSPKGVGGPPAAAAPDPKQAKIQSLVQQFLRVSQEFENPELDPMTERRLDHAAGQILEQLSQLGFDTRQLTGD